MVPSSNSVTDGQVCCMFLDAAGIRNTRFDQSVVRIGGIRSNSRADDMVESGLATAVGDLMDGKVHSVRVNREMVKLNPALLARPFPGLDEFMLRRGAFPLILSIKKEDED